jgi:hypothetical protein
VVLKEEAKKAGIELQLLKLDPSTAFKKILEKRHDVAWLGWSTGMRPHFWEFWHSVNAHKGQTNNVTNVDDPEMDRLIDAYRNSLDETERIDLAHRIQTAGPRDWCLCAHLYGALFQGGLLALVAPTGPPGHTNLGQPVRVRSTVAAAVCSGTTPPFTNKPGRPWPTAGPLNRLPW